MRYLWAAKRGFMRQVTCAHARKSLATPILRARGMAKRPSGGTTSESSVRSKRIDPKWASDFPWMVIVDSEGEGMYVGPVERTIVALERFLLARRSRSIFHVKNERVRVW